MASPEFPADWCRYSTEDAMFLGRLSVIGMAFPNHPGLSKPSVDVTDFSTVQTEISRMLDAADSIASIPGVSFGGLHHSQLAQRDGKPSLRIILSPAGIRDWPVEATIGGQAVQCFINTDLELPPHAGFSMPSGEGCFSSGPVVVIKRRSALIRQVTAQTSDGEPRTARNVHGFGAFSLAHEKDHELGVRAADEPDIERLWVSRETLPALREIPIRRRTAEWRLVCSGPQWEALSTDPSYPFFPTQQLEEAFSAGRLAEHQAQAKRRL